MSFTISSPSPKKCVGWCKPPFVVLLSIEAKNSTSGHSTQRQY